MSDFYIKKDISSKVVMISVTYNTKGPNGGGVSSVVNSYSEYIENFRHISTWKLTNNFNKAIYFIYHYIYFILLLLFDRRIKIVHIHVASDASFVRKTLMANVARFFKKKVIFHMHAGEFDRYYQNSNRKKWILSSIEKCDKIIVLSEYWKEFYIKLGITPKKIVVINNIITVPKTKDYYKENDNRIHALFLGWLNDKKGIFDLIDVLKSHHDELKGKFYLKIGGRDNEKLIKDIIKEEKLDDILSFEGWVYGDKKNQLLEWNNIFILPSYYECLPISILEAMSYGQAIISTTVGGIPEIVKNHENGILIEPGDKEALWNSIKYFIENKSKIKEYGDVSLKYVEPYTPSVVLKKINELYKELLKQ